jgi:hypothetical protein
MPRLRLLRIACVSGFLILLPNLMAIQFEPLRDLRIGMRNGVIPNVGGVLGNIVETAWWASHSSLCNMVVIILHLVGELLLACVLSIFARDAFIMMRRRLRTGVFKVFR